jgi:CPA1 family monovalent cation:H+ antiporter
VLLVELLIGLVGAAIALAWFARHLGLPYPIALVAGGAAIGFVPGLPRLPFDPNLILVLVLPPILYQAALFTSWRDFRANLGSISLLAVGLVIATTVAVAATLKWLVPELPWAVAFAFGAIVSPPDAVAATAIMSRVNVPRRIVTLIEGESLVNDASGLVLYRFAVAAALTGTFSLVQATGQFVLVAAGGIVVGTAIARLFVAIHRRVGDTLMEMMLSLMLPYLAYLAAESLHLSGVLAVVAAGLVRGRYAPEAFSPQARIAAYSLWRVVVFAVNCLVFILIGLQLPDLVAGLAGTSLGQAIGYGVLLSVVAMVVRLAWVFPGAYLPRLVRGWLGRRPEPVPPWRNVAVVGWCGMRGIVSLAAALALPLALTDGSPFPGRDLLVFLAFVVIFVTLVVPGLTLGPLVRALKVGGDWSVHDETTLARAETARAALGELERLERERDVTPEIAASLRSDFEARLARAAPIALAVAHGDDPWCRARRAVVRAERQRLVVLWREGRIGDEVLHEIERELDFEESLLG